MSKKKTKNRTKDPKKTSHTSRIQKTDVLETRVLKIVGESGKECAQIWGDDKGAVMHFLGSDAAPRITLQVHNDSSMICMFDSKCQPLFRAICNEKEVSLSLWQDGGLHAVCLASEHRGKATLSLRKPDGDTLELP